MIHTTPEVDQNAPPSASPPPKAGNAPPSVSDPSPPIARLSRTWHDSRIIVPPRLANAPPRPGPARPGMRSGANPAAPPIARLLIKMQLDNCTVPPAL